MPALRKPRYVYQPLNNPGQQFRLLTIQPNRNRASTIEASLSIEALPVNDGTWFSRFWSRLRVPWFIAISYVWGQGPDLIKTHEIILDGCRFPVTANVHAALHTNRSFASWPVRVWIDSICIDQENTHEKVGQIPRMRDIYHISWFVAIAINSRDINRNTQVLRFMTDLTQPPFLNKVVGVFMNLYAADEARELQGKSETWLNRLRVFLIWNVYSWLSKSLITVFWPFYTLLRFMLDASREGSGTWVRREAIVQRNAQLEAQKFQDWKPSGACLSAIQDYNLDEMADLIQQALFTESSYFSRMWTFQECMASYVAIIQSGGMQIDLTGILKTVNYLNARSLMHTFENSTLEALNILWIGQKAWRQGVRTNLRTALYDCRRRRCHDSKDMIYSLLGLVTDGTDIRLQPGDNKSVTEVYTNATRFIIESESCLDIICCQGQKLRATDLPSWCPDLREFGNSDEKVHLVDPRGRFPIFAASASEKHNLEESKGSIKESILRVSGLRLSAVRCISHRPQPQEDVGLTAQNWSKLLRREHKEAQDHLEELSQLTSFVCLCTEMQNAMLDSCPADPFEIWPANQHEAKHLVASVLSETTPPILISYLCTLICGRGALEDILQPNVGGGFEIVRQMIEQCFEDTNTEMVEGLDKAQSTVVWATAFHDVVRDGTRGRRLAILEDGVLGAVPVEARVGDVVFVLIGCSVPVCLRQDLDSGDWKVIGECYVHGFMDGEAITLRNAGTIKEESLLLT